MVINKHNRLIVWFVNKKILVAKKRAERRKLLKSKGSEYVGTKKSNIENLWI